MFLDDINSLIAALSTYSVNTDKITVMSVVTGERGVSLEEGRNILEVMASGKDPKAN